MKFFCNKIVNRSFFRPILLVTAIVFGCVSFGGKALAADATLPFTPTGIIAKQQTYTNPDFSVENRKKIPYSISVGGYFPSFDIGGISKQTGYDIGFSYSYTYDNFDLRSTSRSQYFVVSGGGNSGTVNLATTTIDILFRSQQFYFGPGVGLASATISDNFGTFTGATILIYSATIGYDVTRRLFVEARYQTASEDLFKGYSLSVGYRF